MSRASPDRERSFEVAKEIEKIGHSVPVILMSGVVLQERESKGKEEGIDFILPRPFTVDDVNKMVVTGLQSQA